MSCAIVCNIDPRARTHVSRACVQCTRRPTATPTTTHRLTLASPRPPRAPAAVYALKLRICSLSQKLPTHSPLPRPPTPPPPHSEPPQPQIQS